jgi:hypothetical protein
MGALESKSALEQSATQDVGKLPEYNVYGRTPEQNERYAKFLEESEKKLADRYSQPNLWNVAAAFAKPQLGGFMASLGSAAEEVGRNEEQRRAQQLPMFKVRAEIEARKANLDNQQTASDLLNNSLKTGQPVNENTLAQIIGLVGEQNPVAQAAYKNSDLFLRNEANKRGNISTSIEGQKAAAENPFLVLKDPMFKGTVAEPQPDQVAGYLTKLDAARPKDIQPEQWAGMGVSEKQAAVARYAAETTTAGMSEEQKSSLAARGADNLLNDLTYLRTLAVDQKLAPMFSLFKNGDAISMFRSFLDKNPGNTQAAVEGLTAAAMDQLKNADDQTRAKADKFIKGLARLEVNLRGSNVNPTDAFQQLNSMQSPNLGNSQSGFVGILDQMGLQAKHDIDRHDLRVESSVPARRMLTSPEARSLENRYRDEASELARANALTVTPSWYKPSASKASTQNTGAANAATQSSASAAQAGSMRARLEAEAARRAQQRP